jgi:hypothetical protein
LIEGSPLYPSNLGKTNVISDARSRRYVSNILDCLIAEMDVFDCFAGVAHEGTLFILQPTIPDRVRGAQKVRLLHQSRECIQEVELKRSLSMGLGIFCFMVSLK